jgi:hypothetical protein
VNEGDEVMLNPETTDPSRIEVFEQLTVQDDGSSVDENANMISKIRLTGTDRIDLALDLNDTVLASKQMNSVIDLGILDHDVFGVFVVFL